jgi:hypothetical protein
MTPSMFNRKHLIIKIKLIIKLLKQQRQIINTLFNLTLTAIR